ncbi:hypothetical protein [Salmonella phage SD-2_S15]|nr:hypothetical protein [Salmonella phage SD-2_S15]
MITFEEPEVISSHSIKGFEYMMDLILKDTYLVQSVASIEFIREDESKALCNEKD